MNDAITGLWVALATPLDEDGAVDHDALVRHVRFLIERGCDGVVPFGTTARARRSPRPSASPRSRPCSPPASRRRGSASAPACRRFPTSVALTKGALALGLVHALVLPPYFYRDATEAGIVDAFAAYLDGVGDDRLRASLYHIPQTSGVGLPPAAVATPAGALRPARRRVKDSSGDFARSGRSGPRRRTSRSASATRPTSPGRSPRAGRYDLRHGQSRAGSGAGDVRRSRRRGPDAGGDRPHRRAVRAGAQIRPRRDDRRGRLRPVRPPLVAAEAGIGQRIAAELAGLARAAAA